MNWSKQADNDDASAKSRLVCTVVDGTVITLDAFDGNVVGYFDTQKPLVGSSSADVVPGLDGNLYMRITTGTVSSMQPLPMTIADLLSSPMRTCPATSNNDPKKQPPCSIVTGTKVASLYGLNQDGMLEWTSQDQRDSNDDRGDAAVILQREDFVVKQVSTTTGKQDWNVTLGRFSALDFQKDIINHGEEGDEDQDKLDQVWDDDDDDDDGEGAPNIIAHEAAATQLPWVSFDESGMVLSVLDHVTKTLLWRRRLSSVISGVYGMHHGRWAPIQVVMNEKQEPTDHHLSTQDEEEAEASSGLSLLSKHSELQQQDWFLDMWEKNPRRRQSEWVSTNRDGALQVYRPPLSAQQSVYNSLAFTKQIIPTIHYDAKLPLAGGGGGENGDACDEDMDTSMTVFQEAARHHIFSQQQEALLMPPPTIHQQHLLLESGTTPTAATVAAIGGGVFLTWPIVFGLLFALITMMVGLYVLYERKKRKWLSDYAAAHGGTPPLLPTNPNSYSQEDGNMVLPTLRLETTNSMTLPLHGERINGTSISGSKSQRGISSSATIHRSLSLPVFHAGHHSDDSSLQRQQSVPSPQQSLHTYHDSMTNPLSSTRTTTDPSTTKGFSVTSTENQQPQRSLQQQQQKQQETMPAWSNGNGNIGGIPLVRYSRYRSEFKEISRLGKGGFGTVFCCENVLDGRKYAVKKVWIDQRSQADAFQRVLREVKILALLDHPNIVRYYTAWLEVEENNQDDDEEGGEETSYLVSSSHQIIRQNQQQKWQPPGKQKRRASGGNCYSSDYFMMSSSSATITATDPFERPSQMGQKKKANQHHWMNDVSFSTTTYGSQHQAKQRYQQDISVSASTTNMEDLGFTFERSTDNGATTNEKNGQFLKTIPDDTPDHTEEGEQDENDETSASSLAARGFWRRSSSVLSQSTTNGFVSSSNKKASTTTTVNKPSTNNSSNSHSPPKMRHILYIQMQLCSENTLSDFLMDAQARKCGTTTTTTISSTFDQIDIPYALNLFRQVARGVQHVHKQGLIHRDLKPSNCFMDDDNGVVKVGDFGLSRESSSSNKSDEIESIHTDKSAVVVDDDDDNTVGVGTRSYASPEQMSGSDYDASTDVFSLGMMLFELCYPMYTGMERHTMFARIRRSHVRDFPQDWMEGMAKRFPSLHDLLGCMLSPVPSKRPTAGSVAHHLDHLLSEFTVVSLDRSHLYYYNSTKDNYDTQIDKKDNKSSELDKSLNDSSNNTFLLRVEALDSAEGILSKTLSLIREMDVTIVQYGLRSTRHNSNSNNGNSHCDGENQKKTIMEFALETNDQHVMQGILSKLQSEQGISLVRQVTHKL